MAYDTAMAERVRQQLASMQIEDIQEKHMFGSLGFMCCGKLTLCVRNDNVMFKLRAERCAHLIAEGIARPVIMRNRVMKNWVFVPTEMLSTKAHLREYLTEALRL